MNRRGQIGPLGAMLALSLSGMLAPPLAVEIERQKKRDEEAARVRLLERMGIKPESLDEPPFQLTREMLKDPPLTLDFLRRAEAELYRPIRLPSPPPHTTEPPMRIELRPPAPLGKTRSLAERKARRAKRKQRRQR